MSVMNNTYIVLHNNMSACMCETMYATVLSEHNQYSEWLFLIHSMHAYNMHGFTTGKLE